jgi:5-methylcytosine-specific restriction endonuclease McrA
MLNKPCRGCGKPGKAFCDVCQAVKTAKWKATMAQRTANDTTRGSRQSRGYDAMYYRNRKIVIATAIREHQSCCICHQPFVDTTDITAEHVIPLREGGSSELSNMSAAHSSCNYRYQRKPNGGQEFRMTTPD